MKVKSSKNHYSINNSNQNRVTVLWIKEEERVSNCYKITNPVEMSQY